MLRKKEGIMKYSNKGKGSFRARYKESSFDESKQTFQERNLPKSKPLFTTSGGYDMIFWILFGVSQLVGIACVAQVAYWCTLYGGFAWNSNADLQFFFHPLLMILGLIFFYGDAILIYRVLNFLPKWILKIVHAALHLLALVMSSVGLAAVFENHRRTEKADMYSLHSWVGITTFGFFCLQYLGSFVTFLLPGVPQSIRAMVMPFHTFFGIGIFTLAVASALMGITERLMFDGGYWDLKEKAVLGNCLGLSIVVFAFLVIFIATRSQYKRQPLPSDISPTN